MSPTGSASSASGSAPPRVALVAGSLLPEIGGHNPLEPALLGCPIVSGRKVDNWAELYRGLDGQGLVRLGRRRDRRSTTAFAAGLDGDLDDRAVPGRGLRRGPARRSGGDAAGRLPELVAR